MDILEEAELAIARLTADVREQIAKNKAEDENRTKPNLDRLKALGMA